MPRNTSSREPARRLFRTGPARTTTLPRRTAKDAWGELHLEHRIPSFLEAMYYEEERGAEIRFRPLDA